MPFSRRIGLRMSAWSTSVMAIAWRSAAMRPAKPRAEGDLDALLDLFLDALGGAGVQRVPLEEEDRDGVDVEDLGHSLQQLLQQRVLRQERERGVGDPLQRFEDPPRAPPGQRGVDVRLRHWARVYGGRSRKGHKNCARPGHAPAMRKPGFCGPVAMGVAAGLLAAVIGDVTMFAAAGVVGLSVLGTGRD